MPLPAEPDRARILPIVLLILTALTGIVDAESFLSMGHVFTANMTGNVVFIAFACAGVPGLSAARSGTALAGFLIGAALGARIMREMDLRRASRRLAAVLFVEATLLLFAAAVAIGSRGRFRDVPAQLYAVIALTALAMGVQNAMSLRLGVPGFAPNVLTTALTWVAVDPRHDLVWTRRVASVSTMFAGALFGAWLWHFSDVWPLALSGLIPGVCGLAIVSVTRTESSPSRSEKRARGWMATWWSERAVHGGRHASRTSSNGVRDRGEPPS
jgi:uncharacterized membrane protein YoaK (UPF0700 family)